MQLEFSSLHTYESRLVFPTILNVLGNSKIELQNYHPNITDLVYLTEKKEQKLNQLTIELALELKKHDFDDVEHHVELLINTLQNEFVESKQHWNALIQGCLNNCSKFKFNKLSEINP